MPRRAAEVSAQSAAQPATCGVAMLVPVLLPYRVGLGTEEKTPSPGPAISIFPDWEKLEGVRFGVREATAMMVGELAGAPVGKPEPLLPAAATIRQPLFKADWPAAV